MKTISKEILKTPRILMIAPVFYPLPPIWPEGIVNANLAFAMKNAGWHIDIIAAGYPTPGSGRYPSDKTGWKNLADHVHIVKINRKKPVFFKQAANMVRGFVLTGKVLRQLDWGLSALRTAKKLNAKFKYDVIISRAIPDYAHFAALLVHRQTRIPWIANWNDPTPNHKFPPPYGQGPLSPLAPFFKKWYQAISEYCTWHTFPSERLRNYICSYLPGQINSKSSVIPHLANKKFNIKIEPRTDFSLCYAGSIQPPREVRVFLEAVKKFKKDLINSDSFSVRFLVDKPEIVLDTAKALGIENLIKIFPTVPYSQMPDFLSQSDVLLIIEAPLKEGIFMPSKIVDYAQIGRPILALTPEVGTITDLFSEFGGGIAVNCKSSEAVLRALQTFYAHWKSGDLNQTFNSDNLLEVFSENRVLGLYKDLITKLKSKQTF